MVRPDHSPHPVPNPGASDDISVVVQGLIRGDQGAAREVFRRFTRRLTALASRQFSPDFRGMGDPEGIVQSVYRSFFAQNLAKRYEFDDWDRIWGTLAVITVRKCSRLKRSRRRERAWTEVDPSIAVDREPTPAQAAMLTELVTGIYRWLEPEHHAMAEGILAGETAVEIAERLGRSERTVRRLRDKIRGRVEALAAQADSESPSSRS